MTVPRALLLVLALLQAGGLFEVVRHATCEEECRRDGCEGDCTPDNDCSQCLCHCPGAPTLAASSPATVTTAPAAHVTEISFSRADQDPPSPDPREILHVPRQHAV